MNLFIEERTDLSRDNIYKPATLLDLKAALAEYGLVAVPEKPTLRMIEDGMDQSADDDLAPEREG